MERKRRRGRRSDRDKNHRPPMKLDEGTVKMRVLTLLGGNPGNRGTADGEPVFMLTLAGADGSIETLAINMRDSKALVIDALIALSTAKNEFATYLLHKYFVCGERDQPGPFMRDDWDEKGL